MKRKVSDARALARRAALNALKRARRQADRAGVKLSEWEGEFLGSVEDRLKSFGRAFGDPEKGAPREALSLRQRKKLKEKAGNAKGEDRPPRRPRKPKSAPH